MMRRPSLRILVNGRAHEVEAGAATLLQLLRNDLGLNGPKYGCGLAQCGACTVLVGGQPARACVMSPAALRGRAVTTLEGLVRDGVPHPVQQAFITAQGTQCGYCLNGMILTTVALLNAIPEPDDATIRVALKHNLCRCGAHAQILQSVQLAIRMLRDG